MEADLTRLVSARFIFPPSAGARSFSSAQNPLVLSPIYQVHQCFMQPGGHWLAARMSSLFLLLPPPPLPVQTCLSHRGPPVFTGLDFSPQVDSGMFFRRNVRYSQITSGKVQSKLSKLLHHLHPSLLKKGQKWLKRGSYSCNIPNSLLQIQPWIFVTYYSPLALSARASCL